MTYKQQQFVNALIDEAIAAVPDANVDDVIDWIMANRKVAYQRLVEPLFEEWMKDRIRKCAKRLGVPPVKEKA